MLIENSEMNAVDCIFFIENENLGINSRGDCILS